MKLLALAAPIAVAAAVLAGCGSLAGRDVDDRRAGGQVLADPRDGGFEVALGEWAVTPEAEAIRPGRTTFVITNRGEVPHGFEIEREDVEADESKVETRVLQPGETVEVELKLDAGVYKLECNVEGHDDMGMEMLLEVSADAPLEASHAAARQERGRDRRLRVRPGDDHDPGRRGSPLDEPRPADHTVTGAAGGFDSGTMAKGATFELAFDSPGEYRYICALHPGMKGKVVVRS